MRLEPQIFIEYAIIPFIILFAAVNAYTDYAKGKIYNKVLLAGFAAAVVWHIFYGLYVNFDGGMSQLHGELKEAISHDTAYYYIHTLSNFGIALLLGFILWRFELWAAGDAKLFAILSLLIPFDCYRSSFYSIFPSHVLLFNMMFSVIAILLLEMFFKIAKHLFSSGVSLPYISGGLTRWLKSNYKQMAKLFVMFILIYIFLMFLRTFIRNYISEHFHVDKIMIFLILLSLMQPLSKLLTRKYLFYAVAVLSATGIASMFIFSIEGVTFSSLLQFTGIAFSVMIFRALYDSYILYFDYRAVRAEELEPGMLLADKSKNAIVQGGKVSLES
ncbi:MAG: hypothetical protein FJ088_03345, partial [Deltaproteobacteria bacterium]|nr:hypothetical protein [Deltaproteobacteria bacterium]